MLYPLRFEPIFRRYLWGGRRLKTVLGKPIGDQRAAESWEVVDHGDDQSVVRFGPLAGRTLQQVISDHGEALLGERLRRQVSSDQVPAALRNRFPLLLKFLDANGQLSIQVHPDDRFGATLDPPDFGKTEAWYVVDAQPGAKIYAGLKLGVDRIGFELAVREGRTEEIMHSFEPKIGDTVFIPAGTMHAIGAGLLIAEIQQASNTTFRVYDWGRVGDDGKSRPLHIAQSMKVTDFQRGPVAVQTPIEISPGVKELVRCEKFVMRQHQLSEPAAIGGEGRFLILAVLDGEITISGDPSGQSLRPGQTILLPASLNAAAVSVASGGATLLEIYVPDA